MPVVITAQPDHYTGKVKLTFPFNREVAALIKAIPGSRWDQQARCWWSSVDGYYGAIVPVLHDTGHNIQEIPVRHGIALPPMVAAQPHAHPPGVLAPYQVECADHLITNPSGSFAFLDPRLGKTPTSLCALRHVWRAGQIQAAVVVYPASVKYEWKRQIVRWFPEADFHMLEGRGPAEDADSLVLAEPSRLAVFGIHYEILDAWIGTMKVEKDEASGVTTKQAAPGALWEVLPWKFAVIADEVHYVANRKTGRYKALRQLSEVATYRWGLTGTPMRNRARNVFGMLDAMNPGSQGGYWKFAQRYAAAHEGEFGWEDDGLSNAEELHERLGVIGYRRTRAEVHQGSANVRAEHHLIEVSIDEKGLGKYRKLEKKLGKVIATAIKADDLDLHGSDGAGAIGVLVAELTRLKLTGLVSRVSRYTDNGHKVIVFCHFHETTDLACPILAAEFSKDLIFQIDGRIPVTKRVTIIEAWKASKGPAILVAGTLAAGIGIDLSDAEAAIFLETEWVPADLKQAMDRLADVHQGKRTTPPVIEHLFIPNTIDEAMIVTVLSKIRDIQSVIDGTAHHDVELAGLAHALHPAGGEAAGLPATDTATVQAAIDSMIDRMRASS